jgi:hypothetical protein
MWCISGQTPLENTSGNTNQEPTVHVYIILQPNNHHIRPIARELVFHLIYCVQTTKNIPKKVVKYTRTDKRKFPQLHQQMSQGLIFQLM